MNDALSRKKIRLGEVASALNCDPKLIRNWVRDGRFDLVGDLTREPQKWREFSFLDVAHLAIAQQAIRYGFLVEEAHDFAGAILVKILGPLANAGTMGRMPASALAALMRGRCLYLMKFPDGEQRAYISPGEQDDLLPYASGCVRINLDTCVGAAFETLTEMGHDAYESSRPKEYTEEEAEALRANYAKYLEENPDFAEWERKTQEEWASREDQSE